MKKLSNENRSLDNKLKRLFHDKKSQPIKQIEGKKQILNKTSLEDKIIELKSEIQILLNGKKYLKENKELKDEVYAKEILIKDLGFKLKKQIELTSKESEILNKKINKLENQISKMQKKENA